MEERFFHIFNTTMYEYNNEKTGKYFFPSHQAFHGRYKWISAIEDDEKQNYLNFSNLLRLRQWHH
jgi:hypothetical protein